MQAAATTHSLQWCAGPSVRRPANLRCRDESGARGRPVELGVVVPAPPSRSALSSLRARQMRAFACMACARMACACIACAFITCACARFVRVGACVCVCDCAMANRVGEGEPG